LGLRFRSEALAYLGHVREAPIAAEQGLEMARSVGMTGQALHASGWLAAMLIDLGDVDRGKAIAHAAYEKAIEAGLPFEAGWCGGPIATALTWEGRFDEAQRLLEEICALSPPEDPWRERAELFLARGETDIAAQLMPAAALDDLAIGAYPHEADVLRELRLAALREDGPRCHAIAEAYLGQLEGGDSPLIAAAAARIGFHALYAARSVPGPTTVGLRDRAAHQLERARGGHTSEWRNTYYGVQFALGEAFAARVSGEPAVAQFEKAVTLAEPFGAYFALEPRLELAQDLLVHGRRDEGRELLVGCWAAANEMGARGLQQRAFRLATRTRVALPESVHREGPLSRLTPREREVLDLLASGATNKAIASSLFISQKTVSTHVSSLLNKLGVPNRGSAVALARRLVG
jgi:DNA-binding CsgD family transcriptional regulator/tetratricopeptide (TPR) repeat protein